MRAKLYWFPLSHPALAVHRMLELKGIEIEDAPVLPGFQRIHLRLVGFRGGTVPAIRLDGRRVQGSLRIARALEQLRPRPPLLPADPALRPRVEEAELWGERELQPFPRRILRWGLVRNNELRRWLAQQTGLPLPGLAARTSVLTARYYARVVGADEAAARRDVESLPAMLARVDELLSDGVITLDPPNVASLQVLATVRSLYGFTDFHDLVAAHPCADAALQLFPDFPGPVPPFVPQEWLAALHAG